MSSKIDNALKAYEERKKKEEESNLQAKEVKKSKIDSALKAYETRMQNNANDAAKDIANRITTEIEALKKISTPSWGEDSLKNTLAATSESRTNIDNLLRELEAYKSYIDEDTYNTLSSPLPSMQDAYKEYISVAEARSKFDSEEAYNKAVKAQEEYEDLLNYNLDIANKVILAPLEGDRNGVESTLDAIRELEQRNNLLNQGQGKMYRESTQKEIEENEAKIEAYYKALDDAASKYGIDTSNPYYKNKDLRLNVYENVLKELDAKISKEKQYYTLAERVQSAAKLKNDALNATDFAQNSIANQDVTDRTYKYINDIDGFRQKEWEYWNGTSGYVYSDTGAAMKIPEPDYMNSNYDQMTEEEIGIYNYYYSTAGKAKAEEYLATIQENLNQKSGKEMFEGAKDDILHEYLLLAAAGIDQFDSGIKNLFSGEDYIPTSEWEYASSMIREDLADDSIPLWYNFKEGQWEDKILGNSLGQIGGDLIQTTSNMLPSILVSAAIPVGGQIAGATLLGASAAGNAKAEMLRLGYSKEQANSYSLLVGASEGLLQYALGGITKLGGKLSGNAVSKFVSKFDNALARIAINLGGNMASEGLEEALQSILEPAFKSYVTGESYEVDWSEVLYSGLLGALSAGALEGKSTITGEVSTYKKGKKIKADTDALNRLTKLGSTMSVDSVAYKLAGKIDENTGAYTIGRLLNEVGASLSEANISDVVKSLEQKGMRTEDAQTIAKWLTKVVDGKTFSNRQAAIIESNDVLAKTLVDVLINPNSTVWQRQNSYEELRELAQTKASASKASPTQAKAVPLTENTPTEENATEGKFAVSESGKTTYNGNEVNIKDIASIKNGEVKLLLDNGETVDAKDVEFSNEEEGLLYEAVIDMDIERAKDMMQAFNANKNAPLATPQSASSFILGFNESYTYGRYGIPMERLEIDGKYSKSLFEGQKKIAYNRGAIDAKSQVAAKQEAINEAIKKANTKENPDKAGAKGGNVSFEHGTKATTKDEKRAVRLAKYLSAAMGIDIVFYDATITKDKNGKGSNGYFDEETNSIHLDLQKANSDTKTIAFTLSHEVAHFIKKWSPEKFDTLARFLIEQYSEHGVDTSTLLSNKMAELGTTDADLAYEEMICDALETMLLDSNAMVKLMQLRQTDLSLFEKLKMHILELLNKLREAYRSYGYESTTDEAKALLKMTDVLEKLHAMFEEAAVDATQSFQAVQTLNTDSVSVSEDGTVRLQMKQYQQTGRATLLNYLREQYGNADANDLILTIDNIYDTLKDVKSDTALSVFGNWQDTEIELDENGHPIFTTSIKNGDYELNQDFSRVCKKRRQLDFVLNMLAEDPAFEASHLTKQDFVKINKAIKAHGFEIACALCFVDSKRFRQAEWADSFANTWNDILNAVVKDSSKLTPFNFATKNPNLADDGIEIDTSKAVTYRKWSDGKEDVKNRRTYESFDKMLSKAEDGKWLEGNTNVRTIATLIRDNPELRHTFRGADIIASQGFDTIQRLAPGIRGILDGWGGSSVPKPSSNDASYDNSIINMSGYNKETAYAMGGVRMNSFSDFMAHMFFDYCQAFADLSAKELPSQAYTKELTYVRFFGRSGQKINMSGIAAIRDNSLPTTASKGVTKAEADANEKIEKMIAGLDVTRLLEHLNKDIYQLTEADVEQFLDMCDYVWADESINMKHATLLQTGILYDKLSESKIEECYELLKAGEIEQALKVAGEENVDTEYAKNCGTIVVGVSDAHIRKLLRDPTVRMVIPYHKSGLNPIIARELRISAYNDYTLSQTTGVKRKGTKAAEKIGSTAIKDAYGLKDFEFYDWFGKTIDGKLYDGKATADKYLEWCEKGYYDENVGDYVYYTSKGDGYILAKDFHKKASIVPKFDAFMGEENYYKVLEDFDCYNTITGEHSAQGAVDFFHNGLPSDYKDVLVGALKEEQKVHDDFKDHLDNKGLKEEVMDIVKARGYEPSIKKQAKPHKEKYSYNQFGEDFYKEKEIYSYDFLTHQNPMDIISLPALGEIFTDGRVDRNLVVNKGKKNALAQKDSKSGNNDVVLVKNKYIQRMIEVNNQSIKHSLGGKPNFLLTNARLGLVIGDVVRNGIPINELNPSEGADGTFAMVAYAVSPENKPFLAIAHIDIQSGKLVQYESREVVHSLRGRIKNGRTVAISSAPGLSSDNLSVSSSTISIAHLLEFVNSVQQSILSDDVLRHFGEERESGYYHGEVKHQKKRNPSEYAPTFYSQMGKVIDDIKMDKIGANSLVNYLKGKGIRNDEIKWSGIEAWLEGKKSVTKAELQKFLAGSQLVIEEKIKAENLEVRYLGDNNLALMNGNEELVRFEWDEDESAWKVEGENVWFADEEEILDSGHEEFSSTKWQQYKLYGGKNYRELVFKLSDSSYSNRAMRVHWGENAEGILVHARIQDLTTNNGKNMLFIEEIQSDWHNEGHKNGYETTDITKNNTEVRVDKNDGSYSLYHNGTYTGSTMYSDDVEFLGIKESDIHEALIENYKYDLKIHSAMSGKHLAPDAPFRDTYHEYVLKRLLRMAAEEGYDSIGWTPSEIQTERWSDEFAEGYRIEYDQDIPKFLRKYGKKWGATVGTATVSNDIEVWSMDITEPMEQSVLYEGQAKFQKKKLSNRTVLSNALESSIDTSTQEGQNELRWLKDYQGKIALIEKEEAHLAEVKAEIAEISFTKGTDRSKLNELNTDKQITANRINTYDKQLMRLETMKPIKDVLAREKEMVRKRTEQKGKEALAKLREREAEKTRILLNRASESRKKGIEGRHKTEMRRKIRNIVAELNQLLIHPTKDKHVGLGLQQATADALSAVNMDTVRADSRLAKIKEEMSKTSDPDKIAELQRKYEHIEMQGFNIAEKLTSLNDAYRKIKESDNPLIANVYDQSIKDAIENLKDQIGDTSIMDMSLEQLEKVYDMYKMVLHTIRTANKTFKAKRKETIDTLGNRTMEEVEKVGGSKERRAKWIEGIKGFAWNTLKPVYAMEFIGSETLSELYENVREGEDVWAVDISEAKDFFKAQAEKYGYDKWDKKKQYQFTAKRGKSFSLSVEQMMSLYAYSKRNQADLHLELGGFVFDEAIEITEKKHGIPVKYKVNTASAHAISKDTLLEIISKLSPEQKAFVDAMQDYLSTTMGAKGNEISRALYDIELFKEKHYFPLKSAKQFMFEQNEVAGEVKIKNSGFSKETVARANNPIILSDFIDVWANHVNDMSMYHAFVLPLEDFNRVFNYKTPTSDKFNTESVKMTIQNAYGSQPISYIRQLLSDLNGGARVDSTAGIINKLTGLFKKSAVFASVSVVIQQPSAVARAMALLDAKYFVGKPTMDKHKETWAEVKKYAPVAIIKEMGYFDTGMGQSTIDWIKDEKTIKDKIDEVASKAPALADELSWCYIWKAVKREVMQTNKELDPNSEAFLEAVGKRFTEVVTKTQVYDSVMSRSAMMRSKDTGMKMATAFMGEPTTSLNMLANAVLQGKRGNKRYTGKAIGAVAASMILNSILVSLVYAGRDDDEDETYAEKYIGTLTEELIDSFNPLTLIPFVKDIVSIVQGYDVERSDMAVITDIIKAWDNLDSDKRSAYRKVEDFAGAIASIFGLPVKNVMRDARGIYNTVNSFINGEQTTSAGISNAIKESVTGKEIADSQQLYEAIISGDSVQIERVKGRFKDQKAIDSAIRKALRENDSRIKEAALARYNGNTAEYMRIAKEIIAEGYFSQDNIVAAINAEINELNKDDSTTSTDTDKAKSIFKMDDYYAAIIGRDEATAYSVKEDLINTAVANGKDRDEAEDNFNSSFTSYIRELYEKGELTDSETIRMLETYGEKSEEEAQSKIQYWDFKKNYPDYDDLSEEAVKKYYEEVEPYGISVSIYYDYSKQRAKCKGTDTNGDGKTDSGSVKVEVMQVINSLPISSYQKDALYYLNGWTASKLYEAPWH